MSPTEATATPAIGSSTELAGRTISPAFLFALFAEMLRVRAERRRLMALDDRMLKDIGLSRSDAYAEASRAAFDLPSRRVSRFL